MINRNFSFLSDHSCDSLSFYALITDHTDTYDFIWGKLLGMTLFKVASSQLSPRPPSSKKENSSEDQKDRKFFVTFVGIGLQNEVLIRMMQSWVVIFCFEKKPHYLRLGEATLSFYFRNIWGPFACFSLSEA